SLVSASKPAAPAAVPPIGTSSAARTTHSAARAAGRGSRRPRLFFCRAGARRRWTMSVARMAALSQEAPAVATGAGINGFGRLRDAAFHGRRPLATIPAMITTAGDDALDELAVRAALKTAWLGRPYHYVTSIDSTNNRLRQWAADPAHPSGTVLLADFQSAGRGRMDRRWEAPPGTSLLFSVLLRPRLPAERGAWLVMAAGLAVA